jgi:hypothetical protein
MGRYGGFSPRHLATARTWRAPHESGNFASHCSTIRHHASSSSARPRQKEKIALVTVAAHHPFRSTPTALAYADRTQPGGERPNSAGDAVLISPSRAEAASGRTDAMPVCYSLACSAAQNRRRNLSRGNALFERRRSRALTPHCWVTRSFISCHIDSSNRRFAPKRLFRGFLISRPPQQYAVLFVVLLLAVIQALISGRQSRASGRIRSVLPGVGPSCPLAPNRTEAQPGRHDFLWIQCAPLAND